MEIQEIKEKNIWENFLLTWPEKTFLQSWNWGEFQEKMGNKIWRLGIYQGKKLLSLALVIKISARRGTFLLLQHLLKTDREALKTLLEKLKEIGREEKADFIRLAPLWNRDGENKKLFQDLGFRYSPMHANAYEATWRLDLIPTEEELLMNMRKTTRYLIRQAMKNQDITIEKSDKLTDLEIYQKLGIKVAKRQKFVPFSNEYVKNEFEVFVKDKEAVLFLGKYKGEVVSAALIIFWSGIAFYHQAASDQKYARFSIPYLVLWEAIKEAKRRNCVLFDFWGYVDPQKNPHHPWAGPTLFKMGFGGKPIEYVKTQDYPLTKKYWMTYLFEILRKSKRGL